MLSCLSFSPLQKCRDYLMYGGIRRTSTTHGLLHIHILMLSIKQCCVSNFVSSSKTFPNRLELHKKLQVKNYLSYQNSKEATVETKDNLHRYLMLLERPILAKKNTLIHVDKDVAKALRLQQIFWTRHQNSCSPSNLCFPTILWEWV